MTTATAIKADLYPGTSRNRKMDVLKGLAITCMVLAHCGFPFGQEIYLFHMAVFFMASGYFYNDRNAETVLSVIKYIGKKIFALYIPYVIFNGLLVLLHNLLIDLKLMTFDPKFLEIGGFGAVWGLQWPYDETFRNATLKLVLKFVREPQLGGATWFLRALFVVSVFYCIFMWVVKKLRYKSVQRTLGFVLVLLCCIGATRVNDGKSMLADSHKAYYAGLLAYMLGVGIRRVEHLFRYDLQSGLFSAVLLYLLKSYGSVSLNVGWIQNVAFYVVASLLGWILLRSLAEVLTGSVASALAYAGKYSMSIVFLHFLSFKVVTLAVILLRGESMVLLASFPQLDTDLAYLWVAYTVAGMGLPLAVNAVYQPIKQRVVGFMRSLYESIYNRGRRSAGS